jgi:hypothetical protein
MIADASDRSTVAMRNTMLAAFHALRSAELALALLPPAMLVDGRMRTRSTDPEQPS